jgi:Outer membrane protein beta-barrel domain
MPRIHARIVLCRARPRVAAVLLTLVAAHALAATPAAAQPPEKSFTGLFAGVEAGVLNVIGGSLVNGVDTLAQDTRGALTVVVGGRYQFANRLVLGLEFGVGWEDGDLSLDDASSGARVEYANDTHTRIGGTVGVVLGANRRTLVFGYLNELSRSFDVTITQATSTTTQQDEQGLLRYGGGVEQRIAPRLTLRATVGSSRADFGGRQTNITPDTPLEAAVGMLFRF